MTTSPSGLFGNFGQTNYGAAKMGIVGLMNTLAIEGQKKNVFTNALAPVAITRLTENLMPVDDKMKEQMAPQWVSAAVLNLCAEHAPNGDIILASGNQYNKIKYCQNQGVNLAGCDDKSAAAEDLEKVWEQLMDMSEIKVRSTLFG